MHVKVDFVTRANQNITFVFMNAFWAFRSKCFLGIKSLGSVVN